MKVSTPLIKTCILRFMALGTSTLSDAYVVSLFLGMYPITYLPYLLLIQSAIIVILTQLLKQVMQRDLRRFVLISQMLLIVIMLVLLPFMTVHSKLVIILISVIVPPCMAIVGTNYALVTLAMFTLREYKQVGQWVAASASIGSVVIGISGAMVAKFFPAYPIPFYLLLVCECIILLLLQTMNWVEPPIKQARVVKNNSLTKNVLFISLFVMTIVLGMSGFFIDYTIKSEIKEYFSHSAHPAADMTAFLANLYAVTNITILIAQVFLTQPMLKKFGVVGLLLALPFATFWISMGMTLIPSLVLAVILTGTFSTLRYGFFQQGYMMTMNVLPDSLRMAARFQLQSVARNMGAGLSAVALIIMTLSQGGVRITALLLVLVSALGLYLCIRIKREYAPNLKQAINLHRFTVDNATSEFDDQYMVASMADHALQQTSPDMQLFGLSLLDSVKTTTLPSSVDLAIASPHSMVRTEAIKLIAARQDRVYLPKLLGQLTEEQNPEVIWQLILAIQPFQALPLQINPRGYLDSIDPGLKACAMVVLIHHGDLASQIKAFQVLLEMVLHPEPSYRIWACRVLAQMVSGNLTPYVSRLIVDNNDSVVNAAITLAQTHHDEVVIKLVLDRLTHQAFNFSSTKTLLHIGVACVEPLLGRITRDANVRSVNTSIALLAKIPDAIAEEKIIELAERSAYPIRDVCIYHLASRAMHYALSAITKRKIISLLQSEALDIEHIHRLIGASTDEELKSELFVRRLYARKRFVYLLAAYTQSITLFQLIPSLLYLPKTSSSHQKALELLDVSLRDRSLVPLIPMALEKNVSSYSNKPLTRETTDVWVAKIVAYKQGQLEEKEMDLIQKVLVLRKVALFSSLAPEILQGIAENIESVDMAASQTIFKEGDLGDGLYIVAKGQVTIKRAGNELKTYGPGEFFGELALLDDEPRAGTAMATEDSLLYFLEKNVFDRLTDDVPEILKVLIRTVLSYLRQRPVTLSAKESA